MKKKNKIENFVFNFLDCEEKYGTLGLFLHKNSRGLSFIRVWGLFAVFISKLLPYLKYRMPF